VPLIPWFVVRDGGTAAAIASIALAAAMSLTIGGALGWMSGRRPVWPALRQLLIVALAAGATWAVGRFFHVNVS
jgi:VIT1/CCC1 family predicted Fe2+/Mn2+ transporter